jgi:hypothetical protein
MTVTCAVMAVMQRKMEKMVQDVVAQPAETHRGHGPSLTKVGIQSLVNDAACFIFAYSGIFLSGAIIGVDARCRRGRHVHCAPQLAR